MTLLPIVRVYKRPFHRELLAGFFTQIGLQPGCLFTGMNPPNHRQVVGSHVVSFFSPHPPPGQDCVPFHRCFLHGWDGHTDTLTVSGT